MEWSMGYTLSSSPSSSGALVQHLHLLGHQFLQKKKKNVSRQQDVDEMLKLLEKSTSPSFDMNPCMMHKGSSNYLSHNHLKVQPAKKIEQNCMKKPSNYKSVSNPTKSNLKPINSDNYQTNPLNPWPYMLCFQGCIANSKGILIMPQGLQYRVALKWLKKLKITWGS